MTYESQTESVNERLDGLTYWGDYGGDIVSRYHYTLLLAENPDVVYSKPASYGQALALRADYDPAKLSNIIRFLAYFDVDSANYGEYPVYDENEYYAFEWKLEQEEWDTGWTGENARQELVDALDWEDSTLIPERGTQGWWEIYTLVTEEEGAYWEGADSMILPHFNADEIVMGLLEDFAKSLTVAGNPPALKCTE